MQESEFMASCEMYDVIDGTWQSLPDLKKARIEHSSCAQGDQVIVFCGYNLNAFVSSIEILDMKKNVLEWEMLILSSSMFPAAKNFLLVPYGKREILIMGGVKHSSITEAIADVTVYDIYNRKIRH